MPQEEFPNSDQDQQMNTPLPEESPSEGTEQNPQLMNPDTVHPVDTPTGQVDDREKAYAMAHSAKASRDEAAEMRQRGRWGAEDIDRHADNVEDWAAILFDHPDLKALQEKYPDVEFTGEALTASEDELESQVSRNLKLEEGLSNPKMLRTKDILSGATNDMFMPLEEILGTTNPDKQRVMTEWDQLLNNPDTTTGQLRDFYVEKFKKYVLNPRKANASINAAFFANLRETAKAPVES